MKIKGKTVKFFIVVLLSVLLVALSFVLIKFDSKYATFEQKNETEDNVVTFKGTDYVLKDNIETFLLIGLDKFKEYNEYESFNNDQQADFLMLCILDNDNKVCDCLHINRDTMVDMSVLGVTGEKIDTVNQQICLSHAYGNGKEMSCYNTLQSVSSLLFGVKIKHFVSLSLDAVGIYNDLLGGVEIEVLDDFTGVDDTLIKGSTVNLNGNQALNYVKSRAGLEDSSNIARMNRQRQYMKALVEKTIYRINNDENFVVNSYPAMAEYILSDYSVKRFQKLLKSISGYKINDIKTIDGETKIRNNHIEFYPDYDSLNELVIDLFYQPLK